MEKEILRLIWFGSSVLAMFCLCIGIGYLVGAGAGWLAASLFLCILTFYIGKEVRNGDSDS